MTLDEIRSIVAHTTAAHWHVLSGDAPTYLNRFGQLRGAGGLALAAGFGCVASRSWRGRRRGVGRGLYAPMRHHGRGLMAASLVKTSTRGIFKRGGRYRARRPARSLGPVCGGALRDERR